MDRKSLDLWNPAEETFYEWASRMMDTSNIWDEARELSEEDDERDSDED